MNYKNTQGGFAVGIVIAIIAILALGGGAAYVATKSDVDVDADLNGTTTDNGVRTRGWFDFRMNDEDVDADVNAGANVNTNVGAGADVTVTAGINAGPQHATYTVTYTNAGFSPATITIESGDEVQFINNSSGGLWVASDNHPTHTLLPEFDQKGTIGANGKYTVVFTKEGTWGFHNHMNADHEGTVIVE